MIPQVQGTVGTPVRLSGYAYDFGQTIAGVQFSLNEGRTWTTYETPGTNDYQTLSWSFDYTPERPGTYHFLIRALNDRGEPSPTPSHVTLVVA